MRSILVVDDHATNRDLITSLIRHLGYRAMEAANGEEGIAIARAERPDLVISDVLMPAMDGYELVRQMRADPALAATRVVFYTAHYGDPEAQRLARACGVSRILAKPSEPEEILRAMREALGEAAPCAPAPRAEEFDREHLRLMTDKLSEKVAELSAANLRLSESEERFRQLAENVRSVFFLVAKGGDEMLYISPAYEEIWGRSCASLYADPQSWRAAIHPDDMEIVERGLANRDPHGRFNYEYRIVRPDGSIRWINDRGYPIRDASGAIYRLAGISEDITERMQLAAALRESEAGLHRAQLVARLAHVISGPDGAFQSWSDTMPRLVGLPIDSFPRTTREWLRFVHEEDRDRFRGAAIDSGRTQARTLIEYRLIRGDGALIHVRQLMEPLEAPRHGDSPRWFSTLQDVTEQKRADEALRESDRRFKSMLENVELISLMLDTEARILQCNDYLLRLTGWSREEVQGRDWFELFIPPQATDVRGVFTSLIQDLPQAWHHENEIVTRSGERRMVRWSNSVLRSVSGEVIGTASIGEDITEQHRAEEEVRRLNADLERRVIDRTAELETVNKELEAFSYSVSHDLRAPLRAIGGFTQIMVAEHGAELGSEAKRLLDRVVTNVENMGRLIDDLLDLSRRGRQPLLRRACDLRAIVDRCLGENAEEIAARPVEVVVGRLPTVDADSSLIENVFQNLIGNALKYTRRTERAVIEIGSRIVEGKPAVFVRDNGAGFDMKYAGKLFGVFQRLHSASEFEGTGVGLAIVRRIVERHGGRVWAEARPGEGATFWFNL